MEYVTIVFFLVVAAVSYYLYTKRETLTYGYMAAFLLLVVGLVIFVGGFEVPTSEITTQNLTEIANGNETLTTGSTTTETQYTTIDPLFSRLLGLALAYTGLHLLYAIRDEG